MTADQLKECREAFEKWWEDQGYKPTTCALKGITWSAWQAAWSAHLPNPHIVHDIATSDGAKAHIKSLGLYLDIGEGEKDHNSQPVVSRETSDGYHTFDELYAFRMMYNAALFNEWYASGKYSVHKSKRHNSGEECFGGGWFVVVANLPDGQITNHYKLEYWDLFRVQEAEKALFEYDGHTPKDTLDRLANLPVPQAPQIEGVVELITDTMSFLNSVTCSNGVRSEDGREEGDYWASMLFERCKEMLATLKVEQG